MRRAVRVAALLVLLAVAADAADYVVIKVRHRPAAELVDAVKAILSPDGAVIPDNSNNTLTVVDMTSVIKKVEALVAELDVPSRHVRLRVTFFEAADRHTIDLSVRWRYSDGGFMIGNAPGSRGGEGLDFTALPGATTSSGSTTTTQDLLIMSGGSGSFITGRNVPVRDEMLVWFGRHGLLREGVTYREVSTGFVFTPTILESEVRLDIAPFFSYFVDEKEGSIILYEAQTTVTVPDGQTVVIAQNETENGKLVGSIFSGFSGSKSTGEFYIAVTPKIED
jgi:type II secretory pathway component GspD/PulD (secretin)